VELLLARGVLIDRAGFGVGTVPRGWRVVGRCGRGRRACPGGVPAPEPRRARATWLTPCQSSAGQSGRCDRPYLSQDALTRPLGREGQCFSGTRDSSSGDLSHRCL
jgi:hypothetical protein